MSLDVYLRVPCESVKVICHYCDHWHDGPTEEEVFEANITHNLGKMAEAAGIYKACWRPEEIGATKAKDIIELLASGLAALRNDPERFEKFNSPNGWGLYENFVPWVAKYLEACRANPEATIHVSR